MDYETFGEHQWEDTGIFNFLRALPGILTKHPDTSFKTPTETVQSYEAVGEIDVPDILTWADTDRDLTAWVGNDIQRDAISSIYSLEENILKTRDEKLIEAWRKLQTSDHFYYMCTKWSNDGDVHAYFSPYKSPYDAYISFMNALSDLQLRISQLTQEKKSASLSSSSSSGVLPEETSSANSSAKSKVLNPAKSKKPSLKAKKVLKKNRLTKKKQGKKEKSKEVVAVKAEELEKELLKDSGEKQVEKKVWWNKLSDWIKRAD